MGLLEQALKSLTGAGRWEGWHLAQRGNFHDLNAKAAAKEQNRRRKNILERVRKMIDRAKRNEKAGRSSGRVGGEEK